MQKENNGFFIQLITNSLETNNEDVKQQAKALYQRYLCLPEIALLASEGLIDDAEKLDWNNQEQYRYILVSGDRAMLLNQKLMTEFRGDRPEEGYQWEKAMRFTRQNIDGRTQWAPVQSEEPDADLDTWIPNFGIFAKQYEKEQDERQFASFLKSLNLGKYLPVFRNAANSLSPQDYFRIRDKDGKFLPFLNHRDNQALIGLNIFNTFSDRQGAERRLTATHLNTILKNFGVANATSTEKAQVLYSLAATFAEYSSSNVFGLDSDSPQALRDYAYALMHEAYPLDENVFPNTPENNFPLWRDKLLGEGKAFTCSSALARAMVRHAHDNFAITLKRIFPATWLRRIFKSFR